MLKVSSNILWLANSSGFALEQSAFDLVAGLGADVTTNSIYLETIKNDQVTEESLFSGDSQTDYQLIKWADSHTLDYEKDTFSTPFPTKDTSNGDQSYYDSWQKIYDNRKKEYFVYDINTKSSVAIPQPPANTVNNLIKISPLKDYKITTVIENNEFVNYLSKIDGTNKIKIFTGPDIAWKP